MATARKATNAGLSRLPSVEVLAAELLAAMAVAEPDAPPPSHDEAVAAARRAIAKRRDELVETARGGGADPGGTEPGRDGAGSGGDAGPDGADPGDLVARAHAALAAARRPSLRPVINATGVIIHTNLGRAPLAGAAREAVARAAGYANLEIDLDAGTRGSRQRHAEALLCELTGAEAAAVCNNCAAATLLACAALAGEGQPIVVSRGQLVEIGGSFRIPEVLAASGARLVEVGTTNRTRVDDYRRAVAAARDRGEAPVILRVHPSNFRMAGFVEEVGIAALCGLGVPVIDDAGSGLLDGPAVSALAPHAAGELAGEPSVRASVAAGAELVSFSGDKLLGGPQAGLLVGRADAIRRAARHPLARATRIGKLALAALEATLRLHRHPARAAAEIPVLAMLAAPRATLERRARRLADGLAAAGVAATVVESVARAGGGTLPLLELAGPAVALAGGGGQPTVDELARRLRTGEPAVLGRVSEGRVLLDPRTFGDEDVEPLIAGVARAHARP